MRVVDALQPGGPEALTIVERPVPQIGEEDVLIKVSAAGVNRADIMQRRGKYPPPPGAPSAPGLEVAGVVIEAGHKVREFNIGDSVCALLQGGGYAEYAAVNVAQTLPVPGGLDMIEAASLPEAYFTVWSNVFQFGRLQSGERLLVHGGSSGIGTAAIQLATALGNTVYTTAGSDEKCRFCEQLGAARAINYQSEDFVSAIAQLTNGSGVNVVLDMIGGNYLARNVQVLATEGRLVMIATQGGSQGQLDVLRLMTQRLVVTGSTLRARSPDFKRQVKTEMLQRVWPLWASRTLHPVVDKVFPLERAADAHAYMESGKHKGKIVLRVG